jgi:hypothetical protein
MFAKYARKSESVTATIAISEIRVSNALTTMRKMIPVNRMEDAENLKTVRKKAKANDLLIIHSDHLAFAYSLLSERNKNPDVCTNNGCGCH